MMHDEAVANEVSSAVDVKVLLPGDGVVRVESRQLFREPDAPLCRRFVERAFLAPQIDGVVLAPGAIPAIELRFDVTHYSQRQVLEQRGALRVPGWQIVSERVGAIKLENPVLYRKSVLCEAIERELMSVLGIDRYETSSRHR